MNLINILQSALSNSSVLNELGILKIGDNYDSIMAVIGLIQKDQKVNLDLNNVTAFTNELKAMSNQYIYFDTTNYCNVISTVFMGAPYQDIRLIDHLDNNYIFIADYNNAWIYHDGTYWSIQPSSVNILDNSLFPIRGTDSSDYLYFGALWNESGTISPVIYRFDLTNHSTSLVVDHSATNAPTFEELPHTIHGQFYSDTTVISFIWVYDHEVKTSTFDYKGDWGASIEWSASPTTLASLSEYIINCIHESVTISDQIFWLLRENSYISKISARNGIIATISPNLLLDNTSIGSYINLFTDENISKLFLITDTHLIVGIDKITGIPDKSFGHFGQDTGNQDPAALWGQCCGAVYNTTYDTIYVGDNKNKRITSFIDAVPDDQTIYFSDQTF